MVRSNWASLSVLAEVGPQNLSHLLENRRQSKSEPVEQVAKAVSRRSAEAAVEPGHNEDARGGTESANKRAEISPHGSSTTQSSDSRTRKAADIVDSRGDGPATTTLRNSPRPPRKRARVVASGEPPRERISADESTQVDAARATEAPHSLPSSIPPRAQARRPRAALAVTATSVPAPESRPKSISPEDALDRARGVLSSPAAAETSSNLTIPATAPLSRTSRQSGTRPRTREPQQSRNKSTHTVLSPTPKRRACLRPVPQPPLSSTQESGTAERDRAKLRRQPVDPTSSRHADKRPSPTLARSKPLSRSRNPGSSRRAPPVPDEPVPAPLASASRASDLGEAEVVKIRTDRCFGHAASHPLNAFDIVAGGTKKLAMQAR